tara:strand:+ start:1250 stop:1444 length:195 start_codon:yes stop_codon:yes gene_type:complete
MTRIDVKNFSTIEIRQIMGWMADEIRLREQIGKEIEARERREMNYIDETGCMAGSTSKYLSEQL